MRRRSLLAALSGGLAGLAGCQGVTGGGRREGTFGVPPTETPSDPGGSGDPQGEGTETTPPGIDPHALPEPPGSARRAVTRSFGPARRLVLAGDPGSTVPAGGRLTAAFLRPPTGEGPARVWIAFENVADERREFVFGPSPPFSHYWARRADDPHGRRAFLLVPDDDRRFPYDGVVPEATTDGRWEAADRLGTPTGPVDQHRIALDPGESITGTYSLLVHPYTGPLPERGTYRFDGAPWTQSKLAMALYDPSLADPGESRFRADHPVGLLPGHGETRWYHRVAAAEDPPGVFLRPERERVEIGEESVEFALENYTVGTVRAPDWYLFKRHGDDWREIGPRGDPALEGERLRRSIPPGGRHLAGFSPFRSSAPDGGFARPGSRFVGLGGGTYAVRFDGVGSPETDPAGTVVVEDVDDRERTTADWPTGPAPAALLELVGPPAELAPTRDVAETTREGSTVTVRVDARFGGDPADGPELVVHRAGPGRGRDLITEQVMQFPALRNALTAFEEGVETVRVVTSGYRARAPVASLAEGGDGFALVYGGNRYEVVARDVVEAGENTTTTGGDGGA